MLMLALDNIHVPIEIDGLRSRLEIGKASLVNIIEKH